MNTLVTTANSSVSLGFIGNLAKSQLLKRLQALPHGYLEIEDGDDLHRFGNPEGDCQVYAKMVFKDASTYRDIAFGGSLGAAQAYMLDKWSTPNMLELVRLMCINIDYLNQMDSSTPLFQRAGDKLFHWLNRNTEKQARENISRHYDLSNDFFSLFLDPEMMYSAAIFERPGMSLEQASVHKLDVICHKLELQPEDHLLEIGTGWGGLAVYAARHFGCRVTTTTISRGQYETACRRVRDEGLESQVTVLFEDYRNLQGSYDKLVSVEMIEAVGHKYYKQYFRGCSNLLKEDGLMLLQAITIPGQRYDHARRSVDFYSALHFSRRIFTQP